MALKLADRVREATNTTGTVAFGLFGALTGFITFASFMANLDTTYYGAWNGSSEWEVGLGTWNTGNTLSRTTVLASSTGGSAVSFTSSPTVWCDMPASVLLTILSGGGQLSPLLFIGGSF